MRFIDDEKKNVQWYNRNYFYAGTFFLIVLIVVLFWTLGSQWSFDIYDETASWSDFSIRNILTIPLAALSHSDWNHVIGNAICLATAGFYLERRLGTFNFLLLNLFFMFICPALASHVWGDVHHHGYSGVIFALDLFIIIDFFFSLRKEKRNLTNTIIGILFMAQMYISSWCWKGSGGFLNITYYPWNLIHNTAHYTGALVGIMVGLGYQLIIMYANKKPKRKRKSATKKKTEKSSDKKQEQKNKKITA